MIDNNQLYELAKVLESKFPDSVDMFLLPQAACSSPQNCSILEALPTTPFPYSGYYSSVPSADIKKESPNWESNRVDLKELEPETGVWVGMSEKSRRVYVYIEQRFHQL